MTAESSINEQIKNAELLSAQHVGETYGTRQIIAPAAAKIYHYHNRVRVIPRVIVRCNVCGNTAELNLSLILKRPHECAVCAMAKRRAREVDKSGETYHHITVLRREGAWLGANKTVWRVRCNLCGREYSLDGAHLGVTKSCTCTRTKNIRLGKQISEEYCIDGTSVTAIDGDRKTNKNSSTGITGVGLYGAKYRAYITFRRKQYSLGVYNTIEQAAAARRAAEATIYGDFLAWYAENHPAEWERRERSKRKEKEPMQ